MSTSIGKLSKSFFVKVLVGIIILPFIFWGMGDVFRGGNQNVIATIDSKKINTQEFVNYLNRLNLNDQQIKNLKSSDLLEKILSEFIGKKVMSLDKKKTSLRNFFNIFWVLPHMSHLLQGKPEDRRSFLDLMVSATDVSYKNKLLDYKKLKNERLRILKNLEISKNDKWLDIIEKKMSEIGVIICDSRRIFLDTLNKCFVKIDDQIPMLNLKLSGTADSMLLVKSALFVEELIVEELKKNRIRDSISGRTNYSVNKTDFLVYEKKSNKEGKNFSTGEQKIIIISILFSFLNALEKINNSNVLFLLDDIFSYLDIRFIRNIIDRLNELKLQTWMTDVRSDSIDQIEKFQSKIHNINIDDNRFKVLNN